MKKIVKLFWIDDMEEWAVSAQDNLSIIATKYQVDLKIFNSRNGENITQQLNIDLDGIIMDYHMNPFNGDKYIREIRFEEHLEHIPIIFYSQDNSTNLCDIVSDIRNVISVYRPYLEDTIIKTFLR